MSNPFPKPGQKVNLQPLRTTEGKTSQKIALVKTQNMEVVQFIIPAGEGIPTYEAQGQLILQCLEGRLSITVFGEAHDLKSAQLLYLSRSEPFSIRALENGSLLVIMLAAKQDNAVELIGE